MMNMKLCVGEGREMRIIKIRVECDIYLQHGLNFIYKLTCAIIYVKCLLSNTISYPITKIIRIIDDALAFFSIIHIKNPSILHVANTHNMY